jgi:hypothetical protein
MHRHGEGKVGSETRPKDETGAVAGAGSGLLLLA